MQAIHAKTFCNTFPKYPKQKANMPNIFRKFQNTAISTGDTVGLRDHQLQGVRNGIQMCSLCIAFRAARASAFFDPLKQWFPAIWFVS